MRKLRRPLKYILFLLCLGSVSTPRAQVIPFAMIRALFWESAPVDFPEGALIKVGNGLSLVMQADGNFVMYGNAGALWASGTYQSCNLQCYGSFQTDGNLVLYYGGVAYWSSGTGGHPNAKLRASMNAPYLQVMDSGAVLWSSN